MREKKWRWQEILAKWDGRGPTLSFYALQELLGIEQPGSINWDGTEELINRMRAALANEKARERIANAEQEMEERMRATQIENRCPHGVPHRPENAPDCEECVNGAKPIPMATLVHRNFEARCECGAASTGEPHTRWCPMHGCVA